MNLFHRICGPEVDLAATVETLLLHVDLATRRTCPPGEAIAKRLAAYAADHAGLPRPKGAGRHVGMRPEP